MISLGDVGYIQLKRKVIMLTVFKTFNALVEFESEKIRSTV
jgi:hypothetical protein